MTSEQTASGTATPIAAAFLGTLALNRRSVPVVAFSALLTTSSASIATNHRFEDTALRSRPALAAAEESPLVKRIRSLQAYEAGWDGPDSIGPTLATVKQAIAFARELQALGDIAQPYVSLANDGEINFYWKTRQVVLDLGFTGTGLYSYFGETHEGVRFAGDDVELGHSLPDELIASLRI